MNNNITNLQQDNSKNNDITKLSNEVKTTFKEEAANLNYQEPLQTNLEQETQVARTQAMDNYIAGAPNIAESLNTATTKPDLDTSLTTSSFTTRDQIMSRLGLMDEDYNYTDTYTNYISQGGQPLPGYEYAHQELLNQERYDQIFQQVEDGTMSYDTALLEAYGKDILATEFRMDLTSVAYWQNKFYNNDFSNPFSNNYLMSQLRSRCEEYHKTREASEWAHSQANQSMTAASLIGEELSADQVKDLFGDLGKYAEEQNLSDSEFLRQINANVIPAQSRLLQIDENTYAFLHTDGKLHSLKKGENIKFDESGAVKEISLNGSDWIDFADHFAASFMGVFRGLEKLCTLVTAIPQAIVTDDSYIDAVVGQMQSIDAFWNDQDWYSIGRLEHIDMDGFNWEAKDIGMAIGDITGMVVGSMALAEIGGLLAEGGNALSASSNIAAQGLGKTMQVTGNVAMRSTGWFAGAGGDTFTLGGKVLAQGTSAHWLNTAVKVAPVLAAKDFQQTVSQLNAININAMMNGKDPVYSQEDMLKRAGFMTAFSYTTNVLLSSNVDSSFSDRWGIKNFKTLNEINDAALQAGQKQITDKATNTALKKLLTQKTNIIRLDNMIDALNTIAGNEVQSFLTSTKRDKDGNIDKLSLTEYLNGYTDGETEVGNLFSRPDFWKNVTQTLVMQYKEYRKDKARMLDGYNAAAQTLRQSNEQIIKDFDKRINEASKHNKVNDVETLKLVKQQYLNDVADANNGDNVEQRIVSAMNKLCDNLGGDDVPEIVKKAVGNAVNQKKLDYYSDALKYMETSLQVRKEVYDNFYKSAAGKHGVIGTLFENFTTNFKNKSNGVFNYEQDIDNFKASRKTYEAKAFSEMYNQFKKDIGMMHIIEKRNNESKEIDFKDAINVYSSPTEYNKNKELKAALKKANINGDNAIIYQIKQEAPAGEGFNPRVKQSIFKTSMDLLASDPASGITKVDDNNYALSTLTGTYRQAMTFEQLTTLNAATYAFRQNEPIKATEYLIGAFFGDKGADSTFASMDALEAYMDTAIANKALTELQAADALHILLNTPSKNLNTLRVALDKRLDGMEPGTTEFNNASKTMQTLAYMEALYTVENDLGKKKIGNSNRVNTKLNIIRSAKGNKFELNPQAQDIINMLRSTGRWSNDIDKKFNDFITQDGGDKVPADRDIMDDLTQSSDVPKQGRKKSDEKVLKTLVSDDISEKELKKGAEELQQTKQNLQEYNSHIKYNKSSGKYLILDLANPAGELTDKQLKRIAELKRTNQQGYHFENEPFVGVANEYQKRVDLAKNNNSSLLYFDLENSDDVIKFVSIANDLKMFRGHDIVAYSKEDLIPHLRDLQNNWDNSITYSEGTKQYLALSDTIQGKLKNITPDYKVLDLMGYENGEEKEYDYVKDFVAKMQFSKLPKSTAKRRKGLLNLLPFGNKTERTSDIGTLFGTDIAGAKQGTIAGKGIKGDINQIVDIMSDIYDYDNDCSNYIYIRNLIENSDPQTFMFSYHYNKGERQALIKKLTDANIIGHEDSFYELMSGTRDNTLRIALKQDQKQKMIDYLDNSSNFNLFRILPMFSDKAMDKPSNYVWNSNSNGKLEYVDYNGKKQEAFIPDMYLGNDAIQQTGLQQILNMNVGYDYNSTTKARIFGELFSSQDTLEYDPFHGNKSTSPSIRQEVIDAYINNDDVKLKQLLADYAEQDYEVKMISKLVEIENAYMDDNDNEAFKFFYNDNDIVRRLIKAQENGEDISSNNISLRNEIMHMYLTANLATYDLPDDKISYKGTSYTVPRYSGEDGLYISPATLQKVTSSDYFLDYNEANPESIKTFNAALDKALDSFSSLYANESLANYLNTSYDFTLFRQNNITKCLQGLSGNDGYIPIEDCEHWANLTDANLNSLYEALDGKLSMDNLKTIRSNAQSAFDSYKKFIGEDRTNVIYRKNTDFSPSIEIGGKENLITTGKDIGPITKDLMSYEEPELSKERYLDLFDNTVNEANDKYTALANGEDFKANMLRYQDNQIRDRYYSPEYAEIINAENQIGFEQQVRIADQTMKTVRSDLDVKNDDALTKITNNMISSAMDYAHTKSRQLIKIYDKNTGENILTSKAYDDNGNIVSTADLNFNGSNYFEVFNSLSDINLKDSDNLEFMILDSHPLDTFDGISYKHMSLNNESLGKLKAYYLGMSFDKFINSNRTYSNYEVEDFSNYLLGLQQNHPKQFDEVMSNLVSQQLDKVTQKNQIIANLKTMNYFEGRSAEYIKNAITPSLLESTQYNNEAINNYIKGTTSSLNSTNLREQVQASLMVYGRHKSLMTTEDINELNKQTESMIKDLNLSDSILKDIKDISQVSYGSEQYTRMLRKLQENYPELDGEKFLTAYFAYGDNPEVLTLKTSGVTMQDLLDRNFKQAYVTISTDSGDSQIPLENLLDINKKKVWFDIEGIVPDAKRNIYNEGSLKDIFQVHMTIEENGETKDVTYFIKHDGMPIEEYINKMGLDKNSYYNDNEGYRDAVETYRKGIESGNIRFVDEETFKKDLRQFTDTMFVAFNGSNYDFNYIKDFIKNNNNTMLDGAELDNIIFGGDSISRRKLEVLTKELSTYGNKTHNAEVDTHNLKDWATERAQAYNDSFYGAKMKVVNEAEEILNNFGIDGDQQMSIIRRLDSTIKSYYDNNNFKDKFVQGMPIGPESIYIQRQLNNLRLDNMGYIINTLANNPDFINFTGLQEFDDTLSPTKINNIVDHIAAKAEADNISPNIAINRLFMADKNDPTSFADRWKDLANTIYDGPKSDRFEEIKKQITSNQYTLINDTDYRNVKQFEPTQKYLFATNDYMSNFTDVNEDLQSIIRDGWTTPLSSSVEGIEQFGKPYKYSVRNKTADKIAAITSDITGLKGEVATTGEGTYKKIFGLSQAETTNMKELRWNPSARRFEQTNEPLSIDASTIVMDRRRINDLLGQDINNYLGEDGELYVTTLRQPSANKFQTEYFKVKVVEGNQGMAWVTPMVWRTKFAGDFDGDNITNFTVMDPFSKQVAMFESNNMYLGDTVQEALFSHLNSKLNNPEVPSHLIAALQISKESDLIKLAKEIDKQLTDASISDDTFNARLREAIEPIAKHYLIRGKDYKNLLDTETYDKFVDDIVKDIGVKTSNGHRHIDIQDVILDANSNSAKARHDILLDTASLKTNLADSIFGFHKQRFMTHLTEEDLTTMPLTKMDIPPTYIAEELTKQIDTMDWTKSSIGDYYDTATNIINKYIQNHDISEETIGNLFKAELSKEAFIDLVNSQPDKALAIKVLTQNLFSNIDEAIKYDTNLNNEYSKILSDPDKSTSFNRELNRRKELITQLNKLKGDNPYIRGSMYNSSQQDEIVASSLSDNYGENTTKQFMDRLDEVVPDNKVTVVVMEGSPLDGVDDGLWVNNKSKARSITGLQTIDLDPYKVDGKLPEAINKFIKEGTLDLKTLKRDQASDLRILDSLEQKVALSIDEKVLKEELNNRLKFYEKISSLNNGIDVKIFKANDDSLTYIATESLVGKKGYALGKGMINSMSVQGGYKDFDIAMNASELSRLDKLGLFPVYDIEGTEEVTIKVKTAYGVTEKKARVFTNVPFWLVANTDKNTKNHPQKLDLMTLAAMGNSFAAHGMLGDTVLSSDGGNVKYSNNFIAQAINDANDNGNICWSNSAPIIQTTRAIALGRVLKENDLWGDYTEAIKKDFRVDPNIHSWDDFQNAILHINPTSKKMQDAITYLARFLNSQGYTMDNIINNYMDETSRKFFTPEIEKFFSTTSQGSVIDYDTNITSKSHAKQQLHDKTAYFFGNVYNQGEHAASRNVNIMSEEYYYVPWNSAFNAINGYYPSPKDILDGTYKELFSYGQHYAGEVGDRFVPKDKRYATQASSNMSTDVAFNSLKNGQVSTEPDANWIYNQKGSYFQKSDDDIGYLNKRSKGAYYQALAKQALNDATVSRGNRAAALLRDLMFAPDKVTGLIRASNRNISEDIIMNYYKEAWTSENGQPVLTVKPNTKEGSYSYLTGKGNDFITSNMNFYTVRDVLSKVKKPTEIDVTDIGVPKKTTPIDKKAYAQAYGIIADAFELNKKATDNFTKQLDMSKINDTQLRTDFTYGADNVDTFKSGFLDKLMTSQGIHIDKNDRGDTINVSMALENAYGEAQMIEANANELLFNLKKVTRSYTPQQFEDYVTYIGLTSVAESGEDISLYLKGCNKTEDYYNSVMKNTYETMNAIPEIKKAMNDFIDYRVRMNETLSKMYDEPFDNLMTFLSPHISTAHRDMTDSRIRNTLHAALDFNEYSVLDRQKNIKSNLLFSFWDANKTMNREMSKLIAEHNVTEVLHQRGLLDNVETTNKIQEYLTNSTKNIDLSKLYIKDLESEDYIFAHNTIVDIIKRNTDIDIYKITKENASSIDQLKALYTTLNNDTNALLSEIPDQYATDYVGLKKAIVDNPYSEDTPALQKAYDYMTSRILVAQRLAELSPRIMTNLDEYFNSIYSSGKVLVNKFGQKLTRDSYITPIGDSTTKWLVDNIEIAANNQDSNKWNQFLMEKALRGELYIMNKDLADQLEQKHFTNKVPNKIVQKLSHISKLSAGLQMAMPGKMIGRLFRFTGTDIMLGGSYSPYVYGNLGRAGKELSAALYSKGATVEPGSDLYEYIIREGQPLNASGKDPITYSEDLNSKADKVIDFFTQPLAVQNHVGRYAIWLAAKESFDRDDPWYGPAYYLHKQVDAIPDNKDKATFIMDNIIGSPGGFPALSKDLNGLMMYTTFPLNLTRTAGAYGMSVATLFQEGITSENAPHWMRTIATPSCTALVAAYLGNLLISYVCDKYGVDEETEKKWQEEGVTVDPLGTIIGGTPYVVYDSMNPVYQLKEMYINPWTNEYNKTFGEKSLGFLNQNVLSKLNPAIKMPTEWLIQKDLMGSSMFDQSSNYNRYENGIRKILGFFAGSGIANATVDQFKIDKHSEDSTFLSSMWKGITNGFGNDIGNQKSWKKDISNYYNTIDSLKNYSYAKNSGGYDDAAYDDLMDGKYMADHRNYDKYGTYNKDDYDRVNKQLKKMIQSRSDPSTVYAYIADEWNAGVSEATLRRALNNNSLTRRLNSLYGDASKADYYRTLSSKDIINLEKALKWEEETYPLLKDFFPDASYNKKSYYKYYPYSKPYYLKTPSTYTPRPYRPTYVNYYPNNGYSNKKVKTGKATSSINKVNVEVSPQMGVWTNDYNKVVDPQHWKDSNYNRVKPLSHGGGK